MPKMKTNRGAAKRFKKTANGKIKRKKAFLRHILTKKAGKRKRALRGDRRAMPSASSGLSAGLIGRITTSTPLSSLRLTPATVRARGAAVGERCHMKLTQRCATGT